jgi:hypothetical protein
MPGAVLALLVCHVPVAQAATTTQVFARDAVALPPVATCQDGDALWRAVETDDYVRPDGGLRDDDAERKSVPRVRPPGTSTDIWSCAVGGRLIVIKQQAEIKGWGECGTAMRGGASVWVDRVKVLSRDVGEYARCFGQLRLISVRLDAKGRFTTCEEFGDLLETKVRCETRRVGGGEPDKDYVAPDARTPPGLELRYGGAPFCAALTAGLKPYPPSDGEDPSLADRMAPGAIYWGEGAVPELERRYDSAREARFDLDNDGREDAVTFGSVMKLQGREPSRVTWRGADGQVHQLKELPRDVAGVAKLPSDDSYVAFSLRPVTVEGRRYVYALRRSVKETGPFDPEAYFGAAKTSDQITRGLLEARPDGSTRLVCGWGPRARPEEAL